MEFATLYFKVKDLTQNLPFTSKKEKKLQTNFSCMLENLMREFFFEAVLRLNSYTESFAMR